MTAPLARRYRALLFTYPRSYRRVSGAEIVTTMLDAAPPERERPTRAEAADLLLGGVRYRFRVRGVGAIVATVIAIAFAAVAGGALGSFLGWQTAPPLPSNAEAAAMLRPALPAGTPKDVERWDFVFDDNPKYTDPRWVYVLGGTDEYRPGQVRFQVASTRTADLRSIQDAILGRMRAAGWRSPSEGRDSVVRDRWRVEASQMGWLDATHDGLIVALYRTRPGAVPPLTVLGMLAGALTAWLLAASAFRRAARAEPRRRAIAAALYTVAVFALFPATGLSLGGILQSFVWADDAVPGWIGYVFLLFRPMAMLGATAAVGAAAAVWSGAARPLPVVAS